MGKIISTKQATQISSKLRSQGKKITIAGGCFDLLHIGHIEFLKNAKNEGDYLFVLLESDESVKKKKGPRRPINLQKDRAIILSYLTFVDYVVLLKEMTNNDDYDTLIASIKPDVIATTQQDLGLEHKERQATKIGGTVKIVIRRIENTSSSRLAKLIGI